MEPPTTDAGPPAGSPRPPAPPAAPAPGPRQLRRRPEDGYLAGVCAGVAEYFNIDPVIVRIAAVVLLLSGPGAFAYVLAWIFVPVATEADLHASRGPIDRRDRGTQIFGVVLLCLALSVIWGDWWSPARRWFFPIGLVALGAWLLLRRDKDDDDAPTHPAPAVPAGPSAPSATAWPWKPTTDVATEPADPPEIDAETEPVGPPTPTDDGGDPPGPPWDLATPAAPAPPGGTATARRRRLLGPIVFGALLIWAGAASLLGVSLQSGLAVGLCILGVGFVLGAFVGGSRLLILPALIVAAALAVTAVVDIPLAGPVGQQRWAPTRVIDVEDSYEVSVGELLLDLSAIDLPASRRLAVDASVGVGHLVVLAPSTLALDVTTDVGAGEAQILGTPQSGLGVGTRRVDDEGTTGGTLVLDLQVGVGQIEVLRVAPDRAPEGIRPADSQRP